MSEAAPGKSSSEAIENELESYDLSFPILRKLREYLRHNGSKLKGKKVGWHCHLTALTAASAKVMQEAGARLFLSECNPATTDLRAVEYMRQLGVSVYLGPQSPAQVLDHKPEVVSDTGFVLNSHYLQNGSKDTSFSLKASCEITTSGIEVLRRIKEISIPVININDCRLKTFIENFHGVGDGVVQALFRLSTKLWAGRNCAVVGYGSVGSGVAEHLRRQGARVFVVELDPVKKLLAHYGGFELLSLHEALRGSELLITATGSKSVINREHFAHARDEIILMNVGHWSDEIDSLALKEESRSVRVINTYLEEFELSDSYVSKRVYLACGGAPANIVMLSGSIEPTLIHLSTEILCLNYLLAMDWSMPLSLTPGENPLPIEIESRVSQLALDSL